MEDSRIIDHREHQLMAGQRGVGLSPTSNPITVEYDFGNNTAERVERLLKYLAVRNLGVGLETADLAGAALQDPARVPRAGLVRFRRCREQRAARAGSRRHHHHRQELQRRVGGRLRDPADRDAADRERRRPAAGLELQLLEYISAAFTDVAGPQPVKTATYPFNAGLLDAIGPTAATRSTLTTIRPAASATTTIASEAPHRFLRDRRQLHAAPAAARDHLRRQLQCNNIDGNSFLKGAGSGANSGAGTAWGTPANITAEDGTLAATASIGGGGYFAGPGRERLRLCNIPSYHTILGIGARGQKIFAA
jgi:hypothetical protein